MYLAKIIDNRKNKGVWIKELAVGDVFIPRENSSDFPCVFVKTDEPSRLPTWIKAVDLSTGISIDKYPADIVTPVNIRIIQKEKKNSVSLKELDIGDMFTQEDESATYIYRYPPCGECGYVRAMNILDGRLHSFPDKDRVTPVKLHIIMEEKYHG